MILFSLLGFNFSITKIPLAYSCGCGLYVEYQNEASHDKICEG